MATTGCYIDVRKVWLTFEVEGHYVVFCHTKEDLVSPSSSLLDALPFSPEIGIEDVLNCEDPLDSDWISYENPNQRYVKMEFTAPMPPNKLEVEAPVSNESSISDYCRFAQTILSMLPVEGFDANFDVGVERVDDSLSDGPQEQFILYVDSTLWHQVMKMMDL